MTTPTLREAADNLIVLDQCRMTPPDDVFRTSLKLAANTLRVIASAQSDAEKAFEAVWMSFDERDFPMTDDTFLDKEACKRIYASGLAAQEAKVKALEAKWTKSREHYEDLADEQEAALATAKADALEFAKEVRRCHGLAGVHATYENFFHILEHCPAAVTAAMERYAETQHG